MGGIATTGQTADVTEPRLDGLLAATDVLGDRWSLPVVVAIADGVRRFSDLQQSLPGLAPNVLSRRLDELERAGVLTSAPYQTRPLRKSYELTVRGADLVPIAQQLAAWGSGGEGIVHAACGTALEHRWWCPACAQVVDDPDDGLVRM